MGEPNLLVICVAAFFSVFLLLTFLSLVMKILINVFPEKVQAIVPEQIKDEFDAAMLAAVSASVSAIYPETKITKVEQVR